MTAVLAAIQVFTACQDTVVGVSDARERFAQYREQNVVVTGSGTVVCICQARQHSKWSDPRFITDMIDSHGAVALLRSGEGIQLRHGPHAGRLISTRRETTGTSGWPASRLTGCWATTKTSQSRPNRRRPRR